MTAKAKHHYGSLVPINPKNAKSYLWNFDDGTTSTSDASTVVNLYHASGIYLITLKAIGEPGDTSTAIELISVK